MHPRPAHAPPAPAAAASPGAESWRSGRRPRAHRPASGRRGPPRPGLTHRWAIPHVILSAPEQQPNRGPRRTGAGGGEGTHTRLAARCDPPSPQRNRRRRSPQRPLTLGRRGRCERRSPGLLPPAAPRQEGPRQEEGDAEHQTGDHGHPAARRVRHGGPRAAAVAEPLAGRYRAVSLGAGAGGARMRRAASRPGGSLREMRGGSGAWGAVEGAGGAALSSPRGGCWAVGDGKPMSWSRLGPCGNGPEPPKRRAGQEGAFGSPLPNAAIRGFRLCRPLTVALQTHWAKRKKEKVYTVPFFFSPVEGFGGVTPDLWWWQWWQDGAGGPWALRALRSPAVMRTRFSSSSAVTGAVLGLGSGQALPAVGLLLWGQGDSQGQESVLAKRAGWGHGSPGFSVWNCFPLLRTQDGYRKAQTIFKISFNLLPLSKKFKNYKCAYIFKRELEICVLSMHLFRLQCKVILKPPSHFTNNKRSK